MTLDRSAFEERNAALLGQCRAWTLTPEQAGRFFALSEEHLESPYSEFYQLPCSIAGNLVQDGKAWKFRINAGATAVWTSGAETRRFGCSAPSCAEFVLLMPDGMNPD